MKPAEFWDLTWPEYDSMRRGYFVRAERQYWDPARHIMTLIYNVNVGKAIYRTTPQKLFPLSFDPPIEKPKPPTQEQLNMMLLRNGFIVENGKWVRRKAIALK